MRYLSTIFFLLIFLGRSFSQELQWPVLLDGCKNFEIGTNFTSLSINGVFLKDSIMDSRILQKGINYLSGYSKDDLFFHARFYSDQTYDTLEIPRLRIQYSGGMHSMKLNYVNCGELVEGKFSETWKNGNLKFEGTFKNGKPVIFNQFDPNGTILSTDYYRTDGSVLLKSEYYGSDSKLEWYMIYKFDKIKVYDAKYKRVKKRHLKTFLESIEWRPTIPIYAGG